MGEFEPAALLAIVVLILVKEAGVPIPVPGDLIVIGGLDRANVGRRLGRCVLPGLPHARRG